MADKTNVMRILDKNEIRYEVHCYKDTGAISGADVAAALGQNPENVFKTLVTVGTSRENYVFVIPVTAELNLKKAARVVGEKSVEMLKSKDLLLKTGYIHGGCSPIGMKKQFKTVVCKSAENKSTIMVSGGKIGWQIEISPLDLAKVIPLEFMEIV